MLNFVFRWPLLLQSKTVSYYCDYTLQQCVQPILQANDQLTTDIVPSAL